MNSPRVATIDQLQELAPGAPPFDYLPQTWGWALILVLLLLVALVGATIRWRRWRRDRYRREALDVLARLERELAAHGPLALRPLPELLKRVALSMPSARAAGSLGGAQWQAFLDAHAPEPLPADLAARLHLIAYAPRERLEAFEQDQARALLRVCRRWIEAHHVAI